MPKKEKRLSKRERKALEPKAPAAAGRHIHCVACGRHIEPREFTASPVTARYLTCMHRTKYPACSGCVAAGQRLLDEHDRSGQAVQTAAAWH